MVDYSIELDFLDQLPIDYIDLLKKAEEYDKQKDVDAYLNCFQAIDNGAKLLCENGTIGTRQWNRILWRYYSIDDSKQ